MLFVLAPCATTLGRHPLASKLMQCASRAASTAVASRTPLVIRTTKNGVSTLLMNNPAKLNGWTKPMLESLRDGFTAASADPACKIVVLTGADPYYCAGVNLADTIRPMHPRVLRDFIVKMNEGLFNLFLDFPKPIIVAANGPAIGACVTSATLCDAIVASERATFSEERCREKSPALRPQALLSTQARPSPPWVSLRRAAPLSTSPASWAPEQRPACWAPRAGSPRLPRRTRRAG